MFQWKSWLLAPVWFYKRGCGPGLTVITSHEVCDVRLRSPGDVTISPHRKSEGLLPGPGDWAPLETAITGVSSSAEKSTLLHCVVVSVIRQPGQRAGGPGWRVIQLSSVQITSSRVKPASYQDGWNYAEYYKLNQDNLIDGSWCKILEIKSENIEVFLKKIK